MPLLVYKYPIHIVLLPENYLKKGIGHEIKIQSPFDIFILNVERDGVTQYAMGNIFR